MNNPILLILAAGMGSRYGGLKQMDGMGPDGQWLLEYSVYDALSSGFDEVVFVVRRSFADEFAAALRERFPRNIRWNLVYQEMDIVPVGCEVAADRQKPLGTGHAIWCARQMIDRPFAVINADDFYGRGAYQVLADWLLRDCRPDRYALVGYPLSRTLSAHGHVSRGLCEVDQGKLVRVTEVTEIQQDGGDGRTIDKSGAERIISGDTPVSMNFWGFDCSLFPRLEEQLAAFLGSMQNPLKDEFYIPSVVDHLIHIERVSVDVLQANASWFGVTYPEDRTRVRDAIAALHNNNTYPANLWMK